MLIIALTETSLRAATSKEYAAVKLLEYASYLLYWNSQKNHLNRNAQACYISVTVTQDRNLHWKILNPKQWKQGKWKKIPNSLILNWIENSNVEDT